MTKLDILSVNVQIINLREDHERRSKVLGTLQHAGFKNVSLYPAIKHESSIIGCAASHGQLLRSLRPSDLPCLVVEDDVIIHKPRTVIELPADADALYLGNSDFGLSSGVGKRKISVERETSELFRCYNMLGAHAILYLSHDYAQQIGRAAMFAEKYAEGVDKTMAEQMKYWKVFALEEPMFKQSGEHEKVTETNLSTHHSVGPEKAISGMGRIQLFRWVLF